MRKLLLLLIGVINSTSPTNGYNFTTFNEPTGIFLLKTFDTFVSYNNWKLYYYYDLSEFFENIDLYRTCLDRMERICSAMPERDHCEMLVLKHKKLLINIDSDLEYFRAIQPKITRRKRTALFGLAGSYIIKPLFGLIDEEDAKVITEKINELITQQKGQTAALLNGLSIIKQSIQFTNSTLSLFKENLQQLNAYVRNITEAFANVEIEIKQHIDFKYISALATLTTIDHQQTTQIIKNALKNTLYGEFTSLITHKQLLNDIRGIASRLDDTTFTLMEEMRELQKVIGNRGTIMQKRLLIEFTIPILEKNLYKLNTIITVPVKYKQHKKTARIL